MKKFFFVLISTFAALFIINISWVIINLFYWSISGIDVILSEKSLLEDIYLSTYFIWIVWADVAWWIMLLIFAKQRKGYKSDSEHYLIYNPLTTKKICVTMSAYNEEEIIKDIVTDFIKQPNVESVIVIDNHSTDRTVEIAESAGAKVITKKSNKGYAHSWYTGLKETLNSDANIIVITDADGTYNGYDMTKMIPYLDNCDMVVGSRLTQVLSEQTNQNDTFLVWGNKFLGAFFQLKYFNSRHLGVAQLTDVGCSYRCMRRESLEKIIGDFTKNDSEEFADEVDSITVALFTTQCAIENDLRIVEIPITFKERKGTSKSGVTQKDKALRYGLQFIKFILTS